MIDIKKELDVLRVKYRESGQDLAIACPFHEDKTPSLKIHKTEGMWHCFSCGKKGFGLKNLFGLAYEEENNIEEITLNEAVKSKYYNKIVKFSALISSKDIVPKQIGSKIMFSCDAFETPNVSQTELDSMSPAISEKYKGTPYHQEMQKAATKIHTKRQKAQEKCYTCSLQKHLDDWGLVEVTHRRKPEVFLNLYYSNLAHEPAILKKYFGISCDQFNYSTIETQNIMRLLLQPDFLFSDKVHDSSNFLVEAFTFNINLDTSQVYDFTAKVLRNPDNQNVAFLILDCAMKTQEDINITEADVSLLSEFYIPREELEV